MPDKDGNVVITMEGFEEALEALKDAHWSKSEAAFELFLKLVRNGDIALFEGPVSVLDHADSEFREVTSFDYEEEFPEYSKIMDWDEFVANECVIGDEHYALMEDD